MNPTQWPPGATQADTAVPDVAASRAGVPPGAYPAPHPADAGVELQEDPVLQYGSARKINKKGLVFLATIGALGLGAVAWGLSQFSLFGNKNDDVKPALQQVSIPEDPPVPPVPAVVAATPAPSAPELPPLPVPVVPPQTAAPIAVEPQHVPVVRPAAPAVDSLLQQRAQSQGLVMEGERRSDEGTFKVAKGKAQKLADMDHLLVRGTYLRCVLETRIVTNVPGYTSCIVTEPVYSMNGRHVVIPKGSKVSGEYRNGSSETGRVAVVWDRVITPDGVDVSLSSPGADGLGGMGHPGHVDRHWATRIGGALLISMMSDVIQIESNRFVPDSAKTTTTISGVNGVAVQQVNPYQTQTATTLQHAAESALQELANIPTTVTINQGQLINIYAARDIDFSGVMD